MKTLIMLALSILSSVSAFNANTQSNDMFKYQINLTEAGTTADEYQIIEDGAVVSTVKMPVEMSRFIKMYMTDSQLVIKQTVKEETQTVTHTQTVEELEKEEIMYSYTDISKDMFTTADLNVRTGPSTDFEKIDRIPYHTKVTAILKCDQNNWYQIIYGNTVGFCCGDYLSEMEEFEILDYDKGAYGSAAIASEVAGTTMLGRLYIPSIGMDGLKVSVAATQGNSDMQQIANRSNEAYCLYLTSQYNKDHKIVEIGDHNTADGFKRLPYVSVGDVAYINRGNTVWTLSCRSVYSNVSMYDYRDITRSNYGCVEMTCCASNGRTVVIWDIVEGDFNELYTAVHATTIYVNDDPYKMNFSRNNY
ncbi:MAG: SH3 domain-containing protein [Acutalibacteraceae bacterium]|nr:SH3 domain-containing protein [Acutalibacteraceae bacterium]